MRKNKLLLITLIVILVISLINTGFLWNKKDKKNKPVELRFSWWGGEGRHKATLAVIELFEKKYPNIKIKAEYSGWVGYKDKLITQLAAGTEADIMQVDQPWLAELNSGNFVFANLYKIKSLDLKNFDKNYLKNYCEVDGKLLGIPTGVNARMMAINSGLFKKVGVPINTVWNWDNLISLGKKFHEANPEYYFLALNDGELFFLLSTYIKQKYNVQQLINDNYSLGFTKPMLKDGFEYLLKLLDNNVLIPMEEVMAFAERENPRSVNGHVGAHISWASVIRGWQGNNIATDATVHPLAPNAKETGIICRPSQVFCISKKSKNSTEAAMFLDFFFNEKDAIIAEGTERGVPPTDYGMKVLEEANALDPVTKKATLLNLKVSGTSPNALSYDSEIELIYRDIIQKVGYKIKTPDNGAEEAVKRFEDRMKEKKQED